MVFTHDIDDIYVKFRHLISSLPNCIRYGNLSGIKYLIRGMIEKKNSPYNNFQKIIDLEERYNVKSTFYFLVNPYDILGYKYYAKDFENEIGGIVDRGCEIGYHTGYYVYNKLEEIVKEKKELETITGKSILGVRNHLLQFKVPDSWNILSKAGFLYDSTFHYHDMVGFRNGMCHPFYPFDINKDSKINILEIPPIITDIAFRSFMKTDTFQSWNYIKQLINIVEKNKGVLTVLWHNWTFSLPISIAGWFGKDWTKLYEKILKYTSKKNAWLANCEEIYNYNKKEGILLPD